MVQRSAQSRFNAVGLAVLVSIGPLAALSGCNHGSSTLAEWRRQPTPNLETFDESKLEYQNRETVVNDTNARMIGSDMARFLLLDRPSRLQRGGAGY